MTDRWNNTLEIVRVRSWDSRSWSMDEILSLMMMGLIIFARILATLFFVLSKDTLEEIWSLLRCYSFPLGTVPFSPWMLIQFEIHPEGGAHCNWERKPRWTTDCLLHSPGSLWRWFLNKNSFQGGLSKPRHEDRALRTRATDAHFSCVLAHVTLAHHTPTLHRWLKDELSIRVCTVILSSHVSSQLAQCLWCSIGLRTDSDNFAVIHGAVHGVAEWMNRAISRLSAQQPDRDQQRAHADELPFERERTANARARSECERLRCLCFLQAAGCSIPQQPASWSEVNPCQTSNFGSSWKKKQGDESSSKDN